MVYNVKLLKTNNNTGYSTALFQLASNREGGRKNSGSSTGKKFTPGLSCITKHPEQMEKTKTKETLFRLNYKQLEFIIQSACHFLFMKVWETRSHNSHTGMWGTTA